MKVRRLLLSVLIICLLGTITAFASDGPEWYRGEKVTVMINGKPLKSHGLLIQMDKNEARTMLPLRDIAETLQAMVQWEEKTKTVRIFKPNVHITPMAVLKDGSLGTFGRVPHKSRSSFSIFLQIDNLTSPIEDIKIEIVDPFDDVVYEMEFGKKKVEEAKKASTASGVSDDMIWLNHPINGLHFKYIGDYLIKVYMKMDANSDYYLVGEKALYSAES